MEGAVNSIVLGFQLATVVRSVRRESLSGMSISTLDWLDNIFPFPPCLVNGPAHEILMTISELDSTGRINRFRAKTER